MTPLERRQAKREDPPTAAPASQGMPRRRREDKIATWLLDQAQAEADQRGYAAGYERGLDVGYAEGEAKVRAESQERLEHERAAALARANQLVAAFGKAGAELDERIAYRLAELALEIGRRLAGCALDLAPEHILDDVEELLENYPGLTGSPTLYVATEDLPVVERHLGQNLVAAGWQLRADTGLAAGDCRLEDAEHAIDSIDADRWARLLQAVGHEQH
jgi:flagellar assembly protein FliH